MSTITYIVKVASAKFTIDGAVAPKLTFRDGDTYVFDQADASNSGHILQFSATSNNSGSSEYTTGVTKTGTPGNAGAKTTIVTSGSTTDTLYYYSSGGGTYGEEFSNSGFNTTSEGILKPIVGAEATSEKWGPMVNHAIDQIVDLTVPKSGGTFSGDVIVTGDMTVSGTTTTIDTAVTVSDAMVINNAGSDVGLKINSTSSGNIMQLQDGGSDVLVVADGGTTTGTFAGPLTGNVTGNASGTAATVTTAAQPAITSVGTLTALAGGTGDFNWDSNTLTVDSSESKVGIGTAAPITSLEVVTASGNPPPSSGTTYNGCVRFKTTAGDSDPALDFGGIGDSPYGFWIQAQKSHNTTLGQTLPLLLNPNGGNVGIGTATPVGQLDIDNGANGNSVHNLVLRADANWNSTMRFVEDDDVRAGIEYDGGSNGLRFQCSAEGEPPATSTTRMFISDAGNVGIGTANPTEVFHVQGTTHMYCSFGVTSNDTHNCGIEFLDNSTDIKWQIFNGGGDTPNNNLHMQSSSADVMVLAQDGKVGIGTSAPAQLLHIYSGVNSNIRTNFGSATQAEFQFSGQGAYGGSVGVERTGSEYVWLDAQYSSSHIQLQVAGSMKMRVNADASVDAGGTFNNSNLDFAEFFEWADGNPDDEYRAGESVVLDGGKIRIATEDDDADSIIGVISETASFTGNAANFGWHKRFVTDVFGKREFEEELRYKWIADDDVEHIYKVGEVPDGITVPDDVSPHTIQSPKMNPDYDDTLEYIERNKRKEWTVVGLLGQVAIKKTALKKSSWIKMKDVSETVELWFVK